MGMDGVAQPGAEHATWSERLRLGRLGALSFGIAWLAVWFCGLADRSLGEPDEGRYAEVAREMLVGHDWITPRLNGIHFFDKPPLHYWATASAYMVFGINPWSARLWCALTGLLAMAAMGWAGARLFGREAGGYAMVILGSSLLFALGSHINTLDVGVTAFLTVGVACFLVSQFDPVAAHNRTWLNVWMWFALALAVLSKGLIGVVLPGMALVVYMVWQRDFSVLRRLSLFTGAVILLVTCAPWFIAICHRHPDFFDYFFIKEHFTRFLSTVDHRDKPWWFFVPVVIVGLFPWAVFLPWNRSDWRTIGADEPAQLFLLAWIGVVFVFFSASHSKLPFYILPLFPVVALWLGHLVTVLSHDALKRRLWILAALTLMGACTSLIVAASKHGQGSDDVLRHELRGVFWP
ncbi:MAG: glycosyltransferase family 39 protein, partial [Rhodanobacter sp.]